MGKALAVHQSPDVKKEVAYFVVNSPIPSELEPMVDMAAGGDVEGIKGYRVGLVYDISRYDEFDLTSMREVVGRLIEDTARGTGRG